MITADIYTTSNTRHTYALLTLLISAHRFCSYGDAQSGAVHGYSLLYHWDNVDDPSVYSDIPINPHVFTPQVIFSKAGITSPMTN